jgi:alkylated DNA repair dioxygenase AlkB
VRQLELSVAAVPAFDASFSRVRRRELAHGAWIDHAEGWVAGHATLFDELERGLSWRHETMRMYDRIVAVPRLLAAVEDDGPGQPMLSAMRVALSARYGEALVRTTAALYRDGADSVAFHGDTIARDLPEALVATVSLGAPRRFLIKPTAGGASIPFRAGLGDLIVMGGTAQRTWRHGVPKVAHADPRIAVMFRPAWAAEYR